MKKILFIILFMICLNVNASGGTIRQSSVIECNGEYYGNHSDHWHTVKKENDKYVIKDSKEISAPSCYLNKKNESEVVTLSKCVDGDTAKFKMKDGTIKTARFLAVDTPESVHPTKEVQAYGKEASKYTCDLLTNAKQIKVEYDKSSDKEDKYGRILVWVYADNEMVQKKLLSEGLAKVAYLYSNYEYTSELKKIESEAKENKLKIWSDENIYNNMSELDEDSESSKKVESNSSDDLVDNILDKFFDFLKDLICSLFDKIISK